MAYFPMFVDLTGRHVLVVGGGKIAARRVRTLLEFGCEITVVSPKVCEELREILESDVGIAQDEGKRPAEKRKSGVCDEILERNGIIWKKKNYGIKELEMTSADETDPGQAENRKERGFTFVLAAATPEINAEVVRGCREKKIPVNNASDRDQCDFYFPGIAKDGDTVVGITSGGGNHRLAAKISEAVRGLLKTI